MGKDNVWTMLSLGVWKGLLGGRWVDKSAAQRGTEAGDVALGLISLGLVCKDFRIEGVSGRVY